MFSSAIFCVWGFSSEYIFDWTVLFLKLMREKTQGISLILNQSAIQILCLVGYFYRIVGQKHLSYSSIGGPSECCAHLLLHSVCLETIITLHVEILQRQHFSSVWFVCCSDLSTMFLSEYELNWCCCSFLQKNARHKTEYRIRLNLFMLNRGAEYWMYD